MRAGRVNSGHASKFNRAGLFCARAQAHLRVRGSPNQFARYPGALLCGQFRRSTWSRNWRVARVISAFTLCQYEHALSQINNGIKSPSVHIVFASLASNIGRPIGRASGGPGCLACARQNNPADAIVPRGKRVAPPCCRGITLRRFALAPGGGADRSCSVWSTIAGFGFTTGRDVWSLRMRGDHKSGSTAPEAHSHGQARVELSFSAGVLVAVKIEEEATMGRGLLLWLIGIPIPIILLIWLFGGLHG